MSAFSTHHLQFDKNGTIWFFQRQQHRSVVGWFDNQEMDETLTNKASQGWAPFIIEPMGTARPDSYVEPNQPVVQKDKRVLQGLYSVSANR